MKHFLLTGIILLLLSACGGGDSNKKQTAIATESLSPPSDPIYDYRHYVPATPEPATLDGFWLLIERYTTVPSEPHESYFRVTNVIEKVSIVSFNTLNDMSVQITSSEVGSLSIDDFSPTKLQVLVDATPDDVIRWNNPSFSEQLHFKCVVI